MNNEERATVFSCGSDQLVAIVNAPHAPLPRGVLIVVGGPQYRSGSHRQFTLLCRALSAQGIPAMRFDIRGMGDSDGAARNFEDALSDIRAAADHFFAEIPSLREIVIWGLCDAASAALLYAHQDSRIHGLVLLNPWVRTAEGLAKTQIKHYYWSRLTNREFWRKLTSRNFAFTNSISAFFRAVWLALGLRYVRQSANTSSPVPEKTGPSHARSLPDRMADGLDKFGGKVLLILSGRDLTAQEFEDLVRASRRWGRLIAGTRVERRTLTEANHTFSTRAWRDQVAVWTADWVRSW